MPIQIWISLVDPVPRPKILGNRLGILTQILIAMSYIYIQVQPIQQDTSNRIYLLPDCFYVNLDLYITLKGTGKIPFVSVLRILLICKFLNIMAVFTEKFSKFPNNFPCKKVNLILMHPTHCSFEEHCYVFQFCQLSVKVTFKQTMKNNGY